MTQFTKLRVFEQARENMRKIAGMRKDIPDFGDLRNQIERSSISVLSNIAEAGGQQTIKKKKYFLSIARGANTELLSQLLILQDLNASLVLGEILEDVNYTGKMLTKLIQNLR